MGNFVIVLGASGSGKSTSIKGLDPKETVILNVLNKKLPFRDSTKMYNSENNNIFHVVDHGCDKDSQNGIIQYLQNISANAPHVKNIIIDDAIYIMRTEFFDKVEVKGYDKYNELGDHFRRIIETCNSLRDDLNIFMMLHTEPIETDGSIIGYKATTIGKLLDTKYNPLETVSIVLFSKPKFNSGGAPEFGFYTHPIKVGGIELPSKSPDGMFDKDFIPNDLSLVVKAIKEYF